MQLFRNSGFTGAFSHSLYVIGGACAQLQHVGCNFSVFCSLTENFVFFLRHSGERWISSIHHIWGWISPIHHIWGWISPQQTHLGYMKHWVFMWKIPWQFWHWAAFLGGLYFSTSPEFWIAPSNLECFRIKFKFGIHFCQID